MLLQVIEYSSLCYTGSWWFIYFTYISVYLLIPNSRFIPPPTFPFGIRKFLFSVCESISVLEIRSFYHLFFLDSTYKWYDICLSLFDLLHLVWYSRVHPRCCKWHYFILFYGWVILHCIYVPHLYPFICRQALGLFPCFGHCEYCCYEHLGACIFLN